MSEEVVGIKESKELLVGVSNVIEALAEIYEDKKINFDDVDSIIKLGMKMDEMIAAFTGLKEVPAELKDLSKEELVELVVPLYEMVVRVASVVKAKEVVA